MSNAVARALSRLSRRNFSAAQTGYDRNAPSSLVSGFGNLSADGPIAWQVASPVYFAELEILSHKDGQISSLLLLTPLPSLTIASSRCCDDGDLLPRPFAPGHAHLAIDISDLASDSYSVADYDSDVSGDVHEGAEDNSASTEAAEAEAPKSLTLAEAFELLSMGAAAVSQAAAAAAATAARQDAAAAAAAPAVPAVPAFVQSTGPWVVGSLFNVIPAAHLTGIDEIADKWYAITKGTYVGITKHNNLSSNATVGVSGSQQNGFTLQSEAITAFNTALDGGMVRVILA
ncbi:hypothetical protein DFH06DRAFT_1317119 [Mycena polygramma]|nr:hypothetical protein DFH06DRAFT_1317119 [Mycena polygramma]